MSAILHYLKLPYGASVQIQRSTKGQITCVGAFHPDDASVTLGIGPRSSWYAFQSWKRATANGRKVKGIKKLSTNAIFQDMQNCFPL